MILSHTSTEVYTKFETLPRIPKAQHTRDILIPIAMQAGAFFFVNVLEELCFQIDHPTECSELQRRCALLRSASSSVYEDTLNTFTSIFSPDNRYTDTVSNPYRRQILDFRYGRRSLSSIYRAFTRTTNSRRDLVPYLCRSTFPLYDLFLIVSDELGEEGAPFRTTDLFSHFFEAELVKKGFYFVDIRHTTHKDSRYYLLADRMENLYRLFLRTQSEYQHYLYGDILDADKALRIPDVNDIDPRETYNRKIKVFRRDGSAMYIDERATVLDFAFHIHSELGYQFQYAKVNGTATQLPPYTRLNSGDTVIIEKSPDVAPTFNWFKYVRTVRATDHLVQYFNKLYGATPSVTNS